MTFNPGIFNHLTEEEFDRFLDYLENGERPPPINAPSLEEIYARIDARNEELKKRSNNDCILFRSIIFLSSLIIYLQLAQG